MSVYIYGLRCPKTGGVRYIGKTKVGIEHRFKAHIRVAKAGKSKNYSSLWIASLIRDGLMPEVFLLDVCTNENWQEMERYYISLYKNAGCRLTNMTGGGDGIHDADPSIIKKMSDASRARWADADNKARFIATMNTPEARANRSRASSERYKNPAAVIAHSNRMSKIWSTPERREEARIRSAAAHADPEISARRVESLKRAYATDEMKAKMALVNTEIGSRPEVKMAKSENMRERWADGRHSSKMFTDDVKTQMSTSANAKWADPEKKAALLKALKSPEASENRRVAAELRNTPEYRAQKSEEMKQVWARRKAAKLAA